MRTFKELSELRQDPVSRDWVIISTGRSKRPEAYKSANRAVQDTALDVCPFEDPQKSGNAKPVLVFYKPDNQDWSVQVVRNKFPIIAGASCSLEEQRGPYLIKPSAGYHEVVITRDHYKSLAQLEIDEVKQVIRAYQARYQSLKKSSCVNYILVFHNYGREAGASVLHSHSQILALPFIPADIRRSLEGSERYYTECGRCVHCDILAWELKEKTRIIFENETMVALAPYAPKFSFEIRIFPKKHQSCFENIGPEEASDLAEALKISLAKIYHALNNISYNFFIHTSPAGTFENHSYYHWHLEINPRLNIWGGFELGTGGDVIAVDPDEAAEYLRNIKI